MNEKQETVRININDLTDTDYDIACSILASSVRRFFDKPGIKEEYEKWLKSEESKRF